MSQSDGIPPPEEIDEPSPTPAPQQMPPWVPRAIRLVIFWVLVTAAGILLLAQVGFIVRYLILALFLAFSLEPAVQWLHNKHRWKRGAATGVILSIFVGLATLTIIFMVPRIISGVDQLADNVPAMIEDINEWSQDQLGTALISTEAEQDAADAAIQVKEFIASYGDDLLGAVVGIIDFIFQLFTVLLFTFYLTANGPAIRRAIAGILRPEHQRRVLWAWEIAIQKTGGYLYSRLILAVINGTAILIVMLIVDVPFALALAVFTGIVAEFIPIIGTYVAGAVPTLVALVTVGPGAAIALLIEILIYQQVENIWLSPKLSKKTIELNAGLAYGAAMVGGAIGGIVCAFFALPAAAVIQEFIRTYTPHYEVVDTDLTRMVEPERTSEERPEAPAR